MEASSRGEGGEEASAQFKQKKKKRQIKGRERVSHGGANQIILPLTALLFGLQLLSRRAEVVARQPFSQQSWLIVP